MKYFKIEEPFYTPYELGIIEESCRVLIDNGFSLKNIYFCVMVYLMKRTVSSDQMTTDGILKIIFDKNLDKLYWIGRISNDLLREGCKYQRQGLLQFDVPTLAKIAMSDIMIRNEIVENIEDIHDPLDFIRLAEEDVVAVYIAKQEIEFPEDVKARMKHPLDIFNGLMMLYNQTKKFVLKWHKREPRKPLAKILFAAGIQLAGESFCKIPIKFIIEQVKVLENTKFTIKNVNFCAKQVVKKYLESLGIETIIKENVGFNEYEADVLDFLIEELDVVLLLRTNEQDKIDFYNNHVSEVESELLVQLVKQNFYSKTKEWEGEDLKELEDFWVSKGRKPLKPNEFKIIEENVRKKVIEREVKKVESLIGFSLSENKKHFFKTETSHGHYDVRVLESDDPVQVMLGDLTHCCQHADGMGESCMVAGIEEEKSGFLVWEKDGKIKAQAWIWVDKEGGLVLDNIETADFIKGNYVLSSLEVWAKEHEEFQNIQIGLGNIDANLRGYEEVSEKDQFEPAFYYDGYTDADIRVWFKKGGVVCNSDTPLEK